MESTPNPQAIANTVVWGALVIGLVLGAAGQASRFCVRGAIADWVAFRGVGRLASWVLAVVVGAIGSLALVQFGIFDASQTLAWSPRFPWLSFLVGGALFGVGMVLAQGCPQRSLVKAGAGNVKAILTLVVTAIAAQMTLRGLFAQPRVDALDSAAATLPQSQDLGALIGGALSLPAGATRWAIVAAAALFAAVWLWRQRGAIERNHWIGGIVVGLLVPAAWWLTGHVGFLAEHPETLEAAWLGTQTGRPEGLSFTAPLAGALTLLTLWTDQNTVATFGVMAAAGVLIGSFVSARLRGDYKVESFGSAREVMEHLAGSVLMGFGGVTALGCSVGQGVTGLAMLSAGALLATAGIVAGAWVTLLWLARRPAPAAAKPAVARV